MKWMGPICGATRRGRLGSIALLAATLSMLLAPLAFTTTTAPTTVPMDDLEHARPATVDQARDHAPALQMGRQALEGGALPPGMLARLASMGLTEVMGAAGGTPSAPHDLADLMGRALGPSVERLPLPQPDEESPLPSAFSAYADTMGIELPPIEALDLAIQGLELGQEGQAALAQLILAYSQAVALQRDATAGLTPEERRFVSLDAVAASEWFSQDPKRTWSDYEAEILGILAGKTDFHRTLQAADLLARAVDAARGPLAMDHVPLTPDAIRDARNLVDAPLTRATATATHDSWAVVESVILLSAPMHPGPADPPSLQAALLDVYDAYGLAAPPMAALDVGLPPSLDHAAARIVAVKAWGIRTGDGPAEALAFVDTARAVQSTLEAWSAVLELEALGHTHVAPLDLRPVIADLVALQPVGLPLGATPPQGLTAGLDRLVADLQALQDLANAAAAPLSPADSALLHRTAEVQHLRQTRDWTTQDAALVASWAQAGQRMDHAAASALPAAWAAAHESATQMLPSTPLGSNALQAVLDALEDWNGLSWSASTHGPADGILFDDSQLDCIPADGPLCLPTLCHDAGGECEGPASILRIGGVGDDTYAHVAVIHIDLGGNDNYTAEIAGPADLRQDTRSFAGSGSYSIDVGGDDRYDTPLLDETQGSARRGVSILLDLAGNDVYLAQDMAQGHAATAVGLLIDLQGHDHYEAGTDSQGSNVNRGFGANGAGLGALLDLAGDDVYRFQRQGSGGSPWAAFAAFIDGGGSDAYESVLPIDTTDLTRTSSGEAFLMQGHCDNGSGLALFVDAGQDFDAYRSLNLTGNLADLTSIKNDRLVDSACPAAISPAANGRGLFLDGLLKAEEDSDGDATPDSLETHFGTDPQDPDSHAGNLFSALGNLEDVDPEDPGDVLGIDREGVWLRSPPLLSFPGMIIGGRANDVHAEWARLIVDLGGDDRYVAPHVGGVLGLEVTVVLDVGGGDDFFAPDPDACITELSGAATYAVTASCPSLGGALNGIAVMGDDGGHNTFRTAMRLNATAVTPLSAPHLTSRLVGYGATQGAGLFNGVGVLVTWDAKNAMESSVEVNARETGAFSPDDPPEPSALARGVAQGAGLGGLGLLAAFGTHDSSYESHVTASAVQYTGDDLGVAEGLSQGAAAAAAASGTGILFDEGGSNRYLSPQGSSQGFGSAGAGILWTGSGHDELEAGAFSQGAAVGGLAAGLLIDTGGNDLYRVDPLAMSRDGLACPRMVDDPTCAMAQGAGTLQGFGLLLDMDGDDVYDAAGASRVQGAGILGTGILLDLAGHDAYIAESRAQGYGNHDAALPATSQSTTATVGALIDLGGSDTYRADSASQGHTEFSLGPLAALDLGSLPPPIGSQPPLEVACILYCPSIVLGLLLDAAGEDHYGYGGEKQPIDGDRPDDGNDWRWMQEAPTTDPAPFLALGIGADESSLDAALGNLSALQEMAGLRVPGTVEMEISRNPQGSDLVGAGQTTAGTVYLRAKVRLATGLGAKDIQQVTFLADSSVLGHGVFVDTQTDDSGDFHIFQFEWPTSGEAAGGRSPDGVYSIVASAHIVPDDEETLDQVIDDGAPENGRRFAATPGPRIDSTTHEARVDNPPSVDAAFSVPVISTALAQQSQLTVSLSRDVEFPSGDGEGEPGGYVLITARRLADGSATTVLDGYRGAGAFTLDITGSCGGQACPDGLYVFDVRVTDAAGKVASRSAPLIMDGTPPTSHPTMPAVATDALRTGTDRISISWNHHDLPEGLGSGNASGVSSVRVLRLALDDTIHTDLGEFPAAQRSTGVEGVATADRVRLLTVATDNLGHSESPCLLNESAPCYRAKLATPGAVVETLVDFDKPILSNLEASAFHVRPGDSVRFTVRAVDEPGSGLDFVSIQFSTGFNALMQHIGADIYAYDDWGDHNPADPSDERPFSYTVVAQDLGGNRQTRAGTGVLDGLPPRVTPLTTDYGSPAGAVPLSAARPGTKVVLGAEVHDRSVASVAIDVSPLQPLNTAPQPCAIDTDVPTIWRCDAIVPLERADGEYALRWLARDEAGNLNATRTSLVRVNGLPPTIDDVHIVEPRHDGFVVRWRTDVPTSSQVMHGRTTELGGATHGDGDYHLEHEVEVRGLAPSSSYFLKAFATSRSGVFNESAVLRADTLSAYVLSLPDLDPQAVLRGAIDLAVEVQLLAGPQPVDIAVSLQDAQARASPVPMRQITAAQGQSVVAIDTRAVPDGDYRILLAGSRSGDLALFKSAPVRIDNTDPVLSPMQPRMGGMTDQARPMLRLSVLDPLADRLPSLDGLLVLVNGTLSAHAGAEYGPAAHAAAPRDLILQLEDELEDGLHHIEVQLPDAAGNVGRAEWNFTVDTRGPILVGKPHVTYLPGPVAARPGGTVRVEFNLTDPASVASGVLKLGSGETPFTHMGGARWVVETKLDEQAAHGPHVASLMATDVLGNLGQAGMLQLDVDAKPPGLVTASAHTGGYTTINVTLEADEPILVQLGTGASLTAGAGYATAHELALEGLQPGRVHAIRMVITDQAGNVAHAWINGTTQADEEAPSGVHVRAESLQAGAVALQWDPAMDNAGIAGYRVERNQAGSWALLAVLEPDAVTFKDPAAPAGTMMSYRVTAVDVAGLHGPPGEVVVRVRALPHLFEADVSPRSGSADEPFTFRIGYSHAGGILPDRIEARFGSLSIPLALAGAASDCKQGCSFQGKATLPPATITGSPPTVLFIAAAGGDETSMSLDWSPRVTAGRGAGLHAGDGSDGHKLPLLGTPATLAALAAACAIHTYTRRKN